MSHDVVVVGAGIIGTATAWRCAQRGLSVALVDPDPDRGAWRTAAGMLAPITELHYTEAALLRLNLTSMSGYPAHVGALTDATGLPTGYRECGTVQLAWDAADLRALHDLHAFGAGLGLSSRLLTGREVRALEPAVAAGVPGGLLAEDDHQVDPRLLHAAQLRAALDVGADVHAAAAVRVGAHDVVLSDGTRLAAGAVILAAGAWSGAVGGAPVRPVKGQTVRLRLAGPPRLHRVVRASVRGSAVYVVPRADGRIVVGASSEEAGFDTTARAGAVYELLRDAQTVVPELGEAEVEQLCTGLRPGSADNAPLIGRRADGVVLATGHHRNGVLLAPVTATAVAALLADGALPPVVAPFAPDRQLAPDAASAVGLSGGASNVALR